MTRTGNKSCNSECNFSQLRAEGQKRRGVFCRMSRHRRGGRQARLHACALGRALFRTLWRLQPEPDRVSFRGGGAHEKDAAGHRRRRADLQQSAQARRRDCDARRHLGRALRCRLCPRLSAARIPPLPYFAGRVGGALSRRAGTGGASADAGERHPSRPISFLRQRHVAAPADAKASAQVLHRLDAHAGFVRVRRAQRLFADVDPDRPAQGFAGDLPQGLARGRASGRRRSHGRRPHVLS